MIIVDYKSTTLRTNPSISVARKVLTILQYHYVETLGRALVVNLPTILSFFYKGISPFLDPVTRDKMRFNPDLFELVPREHLDADFGGDYPFQFDHEAYWRQLIECVRRALPSSFGVDPDNLSTGHVTLRRTARGWRKPGERGHHHTEHIRRTSLRRKTTVRGKCTVYPSRASGY